MNASARLQRKYAALIGGLVVAALLLVGSVEAWFTYRDNRAVAAALVEGKARAAAESIDGYVAGVVREIGWVALPTRDTGAAALAQRRFEMRNLLKQAPAVTDIRQVGRDGVEQLLVSRIDPDVVASRADHSRDAGFAAARAGKPYFGPVSFRKGTEPYMRVALPSPAGADMVTLADINLRHVWDTVIAVGAGRAGYAYVVDADGRLIAHRDLDLVLKLSDFSGLPQLRATSGAVTGNSPAGRPVIAAAAPIPAFGWTVVVEQPTTEAFAAVRAGLWRVGLIAAGALSLAVFCALALARKLVAPVRALEEGALQLAAGRLDHRVRVRTGDSFEVLADQFNAMAQSLGQSQEELEGRIAARTRELFLANQAKSRFLAAASHDLRQPMHALGLFVAQLRAKPQPAAQRGLVDRIHASAQAMGELLDALLDISRLDARTVSPQRTDFAAAHLLERMRDEFEPMAREKGIQLHIVPSRAWLHSDPMLLERIVRNLLANAIRYTRRGRVLLGCRHRGASVRIDVIDTGIGIAASERAAVFQEFYQAANPVRERGKGLGLGLAIVERLSRLLGHPLELASKVGRGSRFSVTVARGEARQAGAAGGEPDGGIAHGSLVVVIDDDALACDAMRGLLSDWGCEVVAAASTDEAIATVGPRTPRLIVSDYRLGGGASGVEAIARVRARCGRDVAAFVVTGDTSAAVHREIELAGFLWLTKPVAPMRLRALVSRLLAQPSVPALALRLPA